MRYFLRNPAVNLTHRKWRNQTDCRCFYGRITTIDMQIDTETSLAFLSTVIDLWDSEWVRWTGMRWSFRRYSDKTRKNCKQKQSNFDRAPKLKYPGYGAETSTGVSAPKRITRRYGWLLCGRASGKMCDNCLRSWCCCRCRCVFSHSQEKACTSKSKPSALLALLWHNYLEHQRLHRHLCLPAFYHRFLLSL